MSSPPFHSSCLPSVFLLSFLPLSLLSVFLFPFPFIILCACVISSTFRTQSQFINLHSAVHSFFCFLPNFLTDDPSNQAFREMNILSSTYVPTSQNSFLNNLTVAQGSSFTETHVTDSLRMSLLVTMRTHSPHSALLPPAPPMRTCSISALCTEELGSHPSLVAWHPGPPITGCSGLVFPCALTHRPQI